MTVVIDKDDLLLRTRKERFVRRLFDDLAARYDFFNTVVSLGMHQRWRLRTLRLAELRRGETLADFCCGTGDFLELAADLTGSTGRLIGLDFSEEMLSLARQRLGPAFLNGRLQLRLCNVERSGLPDGSVDIVTCGYALRNVDSLERVFREMHRILRSGGRVALLELSQPESAFLKRAFWLYMDRILTLLARPIVPDPGSIQYLRSSVKCFRKPGAVLAELERAGFEKVRRETILWGVCSIYLGWKT